MVNENVNIKIKADATALKQATKQVRVLSREVQRLTKKGATLTSRLKGTSKKFEASAKSAKKLRKALRAQAKQVESTRKAMTRLNKENKGFVASSTKAGAAAKSTGSSIGLTGFQFGFLGGMALLAGSRLTSFFTEVVREGADDLGSLNRAAVQSGISIRNFLDGDTSDYDVVIGKMDELQNKFGEFTKGEIGLAFEQIGRAVGKSVSVADVNKITDSLLTMARIDKTSGEGLKKLAVDLKRVMTQFSVSAEELDDFVDKLVAVNQQGAIELSQLVSSLGFAGSQAQRFGVDINETLALTGFIFEKSGRKAGAAGRSFGNILNKLASTAVALNPTLRSFGIDILDSAGNFNKFSDILEDTRKKINEVREAGRGEIVVSYILDEFGFDAVAKRGFLALVDTPKEELDALIAEVEESGGTAADLIEALGLGSDIKLKTFENELRNLKVEFATGITPVLHEFTEALKVFTEDKDFINIIREFARGMGETFLVAMQVATPFLQVFGGLLKDNVPLARAMGGAMLVLAGALTAVGVAFLGIGGFFSLIRIHENLINRGNELSTSTNFVSRAYTKLAKTMGSVGRSIGSAFKGVGTSIFTNLTNGLAFLGGKFLAAGTRAAVLFSSAFNIISNAFIGAGAWLKLMFARIGVSFAAAGALIGKGFSLAFGAAAALPANLIRAFTGLFIKLGIMSTGGGLISGHAYGAGFNVAAMLGLKKPGHWARLTVFLLGANTAAGAGSGGAFAAAYTAASSAIIGAGTWLKTLFVSIGAKFIAAGTIVGGAFNAAFSAGAAGFKIIGTALLKLFVKMGLLSAPAGFMSGQAYGTGFAVTSSAILRKMTYAQRFGITPRQVAAAGAFGGFTFGTAFAVAMAAAILAAAAVLADAIGEVIFGVSTFKDVQKNLGISPQERKSALDVIKDITGLDIKHTLKAGSEYGGILGGGVRVYDDENPQYNPIDDPNKYQPGPGQPAYDPFDRNANKAFSPDSEANRQDNNGFSPGLINENIPSQIPEGIVDKELETELNAFLQEQLDLLEAGNSLDTAANVTKTSFAETIKTTNKIGQTSNILATVSNVALTTSNTNKSKNNVLTDDDNVLTNNHNDLMFNNNELVYLLNTYMKTQIIEVIRNINNISALTTSVAATNLMFANLVAQGNRAAGKLASLRVSKTGKFSISDPGVSSFDQTNINEASRNFTTTSGNQVTLKQEVNIEIAPLITLENGSQDNLEEASDIISTLVASQLQKKISAIGTV